MYYCDELEIQAIRRVLQVQKLFRYQGKNIETECLLFEKNFAKYLGTKKSLIVSSGTNALVNALYSCNINEGDEVIIPAYTFFATAAAIIELKAIPVVVNIDSLLSYDQEDLKSKFSTKTKALIAVHMDGYPCDMNFLSRYCQENKIFLIEDVAQAVGGQYKKKKLGTFGTFGCFSFNVDKIISCGEGGGLAINDDRLYQKSFLYHDSCNQFGPSNKDFYSIEKFSGKSMRVSEIQGAMMTVQLARIEKILYELKNRKKILDDYLESNNFTLVTNYDDEGECSTTSRVRCTDALDVNKWIMKLNKIGLKANSPMLKPAHNVWQWHSLIPSISNKFDYISSIDILAQVLLIQISLDNTIEDWTKKVEKICE